MDEIETKKKLRSLKIKTNKNQKNKNQLLNKYELKNTYEF
jgi:hypothetical protein